MRSSSWYSGCYCRFLHAQSNADMAASIPVQTIAKKRDDKLLLQMPGMKI